MLYYELLKPGETINGERYRIQLIRLKKATVEKSPEYATRYEAIIFHHDNARPDVAIPIKNCLENSGWEVLPHPPYKRDLAPSNYHLFRSMQNALTGIRFTSEQGIKNWSYSFLFAKPAQFFRDGIHKLPEYLNNTIVRGCRSLRADLAFFVVVRGGGHFKDRLIQPEVHDFSDLSLGFLVKSCIATLGPFSRGWSHMVFLGILIHPS